MLKVRLAKLLLLLDQTQWERDHLEQTDGSSEAVIVQVNIETVASIHNS